VTKFGSSASNNSALPLNNPTCFAEKEREKEKEMCSYTMKKVLVLALLLSVAGLAQASLKVPTIPDDGRVPELPLPLCDRVQVDETNQLAFRAYAVGIQRYRWNGSSWIFVEPVATLFADPDFHGKIGTHYVGPTWESNSGGKVIASRVDGCTPDTTAIPWLKLETISTEGPGVFDSVTYIQRVNTRGGIAPSVPGASVGALADVPYTAEYYFYRARD
jgi:hypothetical protein